MSRLFYVSGDSNLAIRTLRLYVQVVEKAWETANAEATQKREDRSTSSVESLQGADTDRNWVQTLVRGARMLCRVACSKSGTALGTAGNGLDEAKEAGVLIEKARTRLDKNDAELTASISLAEGIWHSVMAHKGRRVHGMVLPLLINHRANVVDPSISAVRISQTLCTCS